MESPQERIEHYQQDVLYISEHRDELLRQYPERFVAIYQQKVVGTGKDLGALVTRLRKSGVPAQHTVIRYLSTKEDVLILSSLP